MMEVKEFILKIIQLAFEKTPIDSYLEKLAPSSKDIDEIRLNSIVIKWYATQVYISARATTDKLSVKENELLSKMYKSLFLTTDFNPEENSDFRSEVVKKIEQQKDHYKSVYSLNGQRDITGHPFMQEIGECFASLNKRSDSVEFKKLGSDLFGNCINRCINEFKYERIEFKD